MASPLLAQPVDDPAPQAAAPIGADVHRLFAAALTLHQAALFAEAASLYADIIAQAPNLPDVHSNLGAALADLGRLDEAEAAYRRAIALQPDFPAACNNLGNALKIQGRLDDAEAAYRRAIALKPDFDGAYSNLGATLAALGRTDEAELAYRQAIALQPGNAAAHSNLGSAFKDTGRLDEAEAAYRRAIALNPGHVPAYCNLGVVLKSLGRLGEAEAALRHAIALTPELAEAHLELGNVLQDLGRAGDAEACYRQAIALHPSYAEAHSNLGVALKLQSRFDEAEAALRRAVELRPDVPELLSNMGNVLKDLGRFDEAELFLRRAIAVTPDFATGHSNLAVLLMERGRIAEACVAAAQAVDLEPRRAVFYRHIGEVRRFVAGEPYLAALEALGGEAASLPVPDRVELHFALAKAYDDTGQNDRAFAQLLLGNALKRQQIVYHEAALLGALAHLREVFTPALFQDRSTIGDPSRLPVFIVGMIRSGSTLVEQILASHPQVHGGGELKLFHKAVASVLTTRAGVVDFPDAVPSLSGETLRRIGAAYVADVARLAPEALRVTDKMLSNYFFSGLIHLALPNAIIIHVVRDPVDTCMSCFSKLFTEEQAYTYDLAELGRYYRNYRDMMAHWQHVLPAGRILDVRYEDVVADLESAARRIVAHCGLPWDKRCLDFHKTERAVRTASAIQVRQPLYASAVGRWHAYERHIGPLLAELEQ